MLKKLEKLNILIGKYCLHCLFIEYQTVKYNLQFLTKKIFYYSKIIIIFAL